MHFVFREVFFSHLPLVNPSEVCHLGLVWKVVVVAVDEDNVVQLTSGRIGVRSAANANVYGSLCGGVVQQKFCNGSHVSDLLSQIFIHLINIFFSYFAVRITLKCSISLIRIVCASNLQSNSDCEFYRFVQLFILLSCVMYLVQCDAAITASYSCPFNLGGPFILLSYSANPAAHKCVDGWHIDSLQRYSFHCKCIRLNLVSSSYHTIG